MKTHTAQLIRMIRKTTGEPVLGAEIGVWRGANSAVLLRTFPGLTLVMVDPWASYGSASLDTSVTSMTEAERQALEVTEFAADRRVAVKATSQEAAEFYRPFACQFDFVFVDANHAYEHVKQDICLWWPLIREGGLLAGHDYRSRLNKAGKWGVKKAVDEFAVEVGRPVTAKWNVWSIVK